MCTEERNELLNIVYFSDSSRQVKARALAVILASSGIEKKQISKAISISDRTVSKHVKRYQVIGIKAITQDKRYRPVSALDEYKDLKKEFEERPCATVREGKYRIEKLTGIKIGLTQTRAFMKKIGLKPLKVGHIPAKADVVEQKEFLEEKLEPKLKEAKEQKRKVFFVDASHFVMAAFLGVLWTVTRKFIKSPSGRQRFNVLGALDADTLKLTTVTNNTYINAQSICELLEKLRRQYCKELITLVLDNARYQKCNIVVEKARELNIELLYLPAYSPNLNLIERVWRLIKKDCLYSNYYENFNEFTTAILNCIERINDGSMDKEVRSLLTLKFQLFDEFKEILHAA